MLDVIQVYKAVFNTTPSKIVRVPAGVPLLGTYATQQNGLSAWIAVDRYIDIAFTPRIDGKIILTFSRTKKRIQFWITELEQGSGHIYVDCLKSVLSELRNRRVYFGGFNAAISSTLPPGYPWHFMEAFAVAVALVTRELHPYSLSEFGVNRPPIRNRSGVLPKMTDAEKHYLATLCDVALRKTGTFQIEKQAALVSLTAETLHINFFDCQHGVFETFGILTDIGVVLCPLGLTVAEGQEREIAKKRALCELARRKMRVRSLRSVDLKRLKNRQGRLTDDEYRCSYHLLRENIRVMGAERAVQSGDYAQFGRYMDESYEEKRDFFDHYIAEVEAIMSFARSRVECLGSRTMGEGVGSMTVHLLPFTRMKPFVRHLVENYETKTGRRIQPHSCRIIRGAGLWDPTWV